ncbi:MAG: hypothetical protein SNH27_12915 [Rikenellaceae bacterium]
MSREDKDPKDITLYDIVYALEGDEPVECCGDILTCKPRKCKDCSIYEELQKVIEYHKKTLSTTTIAYKHYEEVNL